MKKPTKALIKQQLETAVRRGEELLDYTRRLEEQVKELEEALKAIVTIELPEERTKIADLKKDNANLEWQGQEYHKQQILNENKITELEEINDSLRRLTEPIPDSEVETENKKLKKYIEDLQAENDLLRQQLGSEPTTADEFNNEDNEYSDIIEKPIEHTSGYIQPESYIRLLAGRIEQLIIDKNVVSFSTYEMLYKLQKTYRLNNTKYSDVQSAIYMLIEQGKINHVRSDIGRTPRYIVNED